MKALLSALIFTSGLAALAAGPSPESSLSGVELKACDPAGRKCLTVKSAKTSGSQFKPIQQLKKPVVTYRDSKTKKVERVEGTTGYLDLENHQVVIYERRGADLREIAFDLNSLQRRESEIR